MAELIKKKISKENKTKCAMDFRGYFLVFLFPIDAGMDTFQFHSTKWSDTQQGHKEWVIYQLVRLHKSKNLSSLDKKSNYKNFEQKHFVTKKSSKYLRWKKILGQKNCCQQKICSKKYSSTRQVYNGSRIVKFIGAIRK